MPAINRLCCCSLPLPRRTRDAKPYIHIFLDAVSEKKKAIAAYMREHPEVTSKSAIAKAAGTNRNTVQKYCNEIRSELGLKYAQELSL